MTTYVMEFPGGDRTSFQASEKDAMSEARRISAIYGHESPPIFWVETVVISRHEGAVEWLENQGIFADRHINHVEDSSDIAGCIVYGNIPLHLAAIADSVFSIEIPNLPPEFRGKDLTPKEMDKFGAMLRRYVVREIK